VVTEFVATESGTRKIQMGLAGQNAVYSWMRAHPEAIFFGL
jgi:hypothetical protein